MRRVLILLITLFATQGMGYSENWHKLLLSLTSTDPAVSGPARDYLFGQVLPVLLTEDTESLNRQVPLLLQEFGSDEHIRLQVSGMLAGLAINRRDGDIALRGAIGNWLTQASDHNNRVAYNAVVALANLKPAIPAEAGPILVKATEGSDARFVGVGAYGLARLGAGNPAAISALEKGLSNRQDPKVRRAVITALGTAGSLAPQLVPAFATLLETGDDETVLDALKTIRRSGQSAISALANQLSDLAQNAKNDQIRHICTDLLTH